MATVQDNSMYGVSIQFKYKNSNAWSGTEVLLAGEIGLEIDTKKYKLGDGSTTWSELPYYSDPIISDAVDALTTRMTSAESSITAIQQKDSEQDDSITALEEKDTVHESRMTTIEAKDTAQDASITALEAKDTAHESRMTDIEAKDTAQDARLTALEGITVISANPAPSV